MLNWRHSWVGLCLLAIVSLAPAVHAQSEAPESLWADFNHYVRIAKSDLAQAAGQKLLSTVSDAQLLDIVENSPAYQDYDRTLQRAEKVEALKETANTFEKRIQQARIARSREPARISADIHKLGEGARANYNATERLRAAGPYAAPALLNALLDQNQKNLHPYVLEAMVAIGRPIVAPLTAALPELEPVQQGQVAQVLAQIGYPRALPVLQFVIQDPKTDPAAKVIAKTAYKQLANSVNLQGQYTAADLYLQLADNLFTVATDHPDQLIGLDTATHKGLVWSYTRGIGLNYISVPEAIFGDVESMNAAMTALTLDPEMDYALSAWLMANLRRQNRLPSGETDPSYSAKMLPPAFYLEMAGPLRQHDVLARALAINDADLALDAIHALTATAGTDALINIKGTAQPLLAALSSPDRRVRYSAAFALTNARPTHTFPGFERVVPVLAQAIRQSDVRYAAVIAKDTASANRIKDALASLGYQTFGNTTLRAVQDYQADEPGADILVTDLDPKDIEILVNQSANDYKLASVPVVVLSTPGQQNRLNTMFGTGSRIHPALWDGDQAKLQAALEQIVKNSAGKPMGAAEALQYATQALSLLDEVVLDAGEVYNILDAQASLIKALHDPRATIVQQAANVLSRINTPQAQQAIADAALDIARTSEVRIGLLGSLSQSATSFGNHLNDTQLQAILKLVKTSRGQLAIAAAQTHGALNLPTANVVELLLQANSNAE